MYRGVDQCFKTLLLFPVYFFGVVRSALFNELPVLIKKRKHYFSFIWTILILSHCWQVIFPTQQYIFSNLHGNRHSSHQLDPFFIGKPSIGLKRTWDRSVEDWHQAESKFQYNSNLTDYTLIYKINTRYLD